MPVTLLPNSVWGNAARVVATSTSDVELADQAGIESVTGGGRYLYYTGAGSGNLRVTYVNKAGGLACDHCVIVNAASHLGHFVRLRSWTNYPSVSSSFFTEDPFAQPLVGPKGKDFVYQFNALSGLQAVALELDSGAGGSYSKIVQQVYFSTGYTFQNIDQLRRKVLKKGEPYSVRRRSYQVSEEVNFIASAVSRAELQAFERLYKLKDEPLFLYESAGVRILDKLLHGFVKDFKTVAVADDLHTVAVDFLALEYY